MAAPTSDERRDVAKRLRITKAECESRDYPWMVEDLMQALGFKRYEDGEDGIFNRLVDLIDPTCHVVGTTSYDWSYGYETYIYHLSCGHEVYTDWADPPDFCPNCGARLVSDDDASRD